MAIFSAPLKLLRCLRIWVFLHGYYLLWCNSKGRILQIGPKRDTMRTSCSLSILYSSAILTAIAILGASQASAQCSQEEKLIDEAAGAGNTFGTSVSVSEDTALIGASGSATVFRFNGLSWVEEQSLLPSDEGGSFGTAVSVSGDIAVVGAPHDDELGIDSGAAYVFRFNGSTWEEEQKLAASDPGQYNLFGRAVSVDGSTVMIGSGGSFESPELSSAYMFRFNGIAWIEEQKLIASDGTGGGWHRDTVSVNGDIAIVGAPGDDCSTGPDCGAAYIFQYNGSSWTEMQKLTPSSQGAYPEFGGSVALDGCMAVVGGAGSVIVFSRHGTSWVEEQQLIEPAAGTSFGVSISINNERIVVGAFQDGCQAGPGQCGSALVYRLYGTTWVEEQELAASDGAAGDWFGGSVFVSGDIIVAGASGDDCKAGINCGSAYVFRCSEFGPYGDVNHDAVVGLADLVCVLDGFRGVFQDCPFRELDIAPPPQGDGVIDLFDILGVLDAFDGSSSCF